MYKRILLKLSGESLMGTKGYGIDEQRLADYAQQIRNIAATGVQVAIVIGGGNIWRGRQGGGMDRVRADKMGMLATVMNAIAVQDSLIGQGLDARIMTPIVIQGVSEQFSRDEAIRYLESGKVVIFGAGTGSPFFSTDTGALLRAAEIKADAALFAKNIDGVYTADPKKDPTATKIDNITYDEIIEKRLGVIDLTAAVFGMDNKMQVLLFGLAEPENIIKAVNGEKIGTLLTL